MDSQRIVSARYNDAVAILNPDDNIWDIWADQNGTEETIGHGDTQEAAWDMAANLIQGD